MGYGIANKFIKEVLFWTTLLMHTCIQPNFFKHGCRPFPIKCFHVSLDFIGDLNRNNGFHTTTSTRMQVIKGILILSKLVLMKLKICYGLCVWDCFTISLR